MRSTTTRTRVLTPELELHICATSWHRPIPLQAPTICRANTRALAGVRLRRHTANAQHSMLLAPTHITLCLRAVRTLRSRETIRCRVKFSTHGRCQLHVIYSYGRSSIFPKGGRFAATDMLNALPRDSAPDLSRDASARFTCSTCEQTFQSRLPRCTDCSCARYCSVDCQLRDFVLHQHLCGALGRARSRWVAGYDHEARSVSLPFLLGTSPSLDLADALLALTVYEQCAQSPAGSGLVLTRADDASSKVLSCAVLRLSDDDNTTLALYVFYNKGVQMLHAVGPSRLRDTDLKFAVRSGALHVQSILDTTVKLYQNFTNMVRLTDALSRMLTNGPNQQPAQRGNNTDEEGADNTVQSRDSSQVCVHAENEGVCAASTSGTVEPSTETDTNTGASLV